MAPIPAFLLELGSAPRWATDSLAALAVCCAASLVAPGEARACTTLFEPQYAGAPADGDVDVPTDVELTVDASLLWGPPVEPNEVMATLTSSTGQVIEAAVGQPYVWSYTITPREELEPDTRYTLELSVENERELEPWTIEFTTGAGPFAGAVEPPNGAFLQHYHLAQEPENSCSPPQNGTCVTLPDGQEVEVRSIDEFGQVHEPYLRRGAYFTNLSGVDQGTTFECVELRTRALNGDVSEPVVRCGDEAESVALEDEADVVCTADGIPLAGPIDEGPYEGPGQDQGQDQGDDHDDHQGDDHEADIDGDDDETEKVACHMGATRGSDGAAPLALLALFGLAGRVRRERAPHVTR